MFSTPSFLLVYFCISVTILICRDSFGNPEEEVHWTDKRSNSSRGLGFRNKSKHGRTTTARPKWRPKQNGKLLLAKQKGMKIENESQIPANDPEFTYAWPDDYYDNYDFEHHKNMIQHGTFESRIHNYYKAELAEALANLNATASQSNFTEYEDESTTRQTEEVKPQKIVTTTTTRTAKVGTKMPELKKPIPVTTGSPKAKVPNPFTTISTTTTTSTRKPRVKKKRTKVPKKNKYHPGL